MYDFAVSFFVLMTIAESMQSMKVLDEEERSDQQLRDQFKEKWTRTASAGLTKPMREEAGKYKIILDTAIQADSIVRDKYNTHKSAISLLSKPKVWFKKMNVYCFLMMNVHAS